jgi:UDP-GlcNAc:undecaprenyl-phosphate GlcNAc-1-phosphate transferase
LYFSISSWAFANAAAASLGFADSPKARALRILSLILSGVALGFVLFDFPKPMILMGDSGSTFFGFLIGSLAIFSGGKLATAFLVLGIPLLDMVWVVMRRIYERKKFWEGDLKHLHHRLLDLGWSDRRVVVSYLSVTFVLGFSAIFLVNAQQKLYMILAMMIFLILLFGVLVFLPKK